MSPDRSIPDFFIAGAPKCGTTSLYSWLRTHPRLFMPCKEPGFFSRDLLDHPDLQFHLYRRLFDDRPECTLVGEASPKYLYSAVGLREIRSHRPDARILILLRNPVDLVHSFHGQMVKQCDEVVTDFEAAWRLVDSRSEGAALPRMCRSATLVDYPFWGRIGSRLQDLFSVFPANQIRVYLLNDMQLHPATLYADVLEFLGVEHDGRTDFGAENPRVRVRSTAAHGALVGLRRRIWPILRSRGVGGTGLLRLLHRWNVSDAPETSMSDRFRQELIRFFADEVRLVEQILERDLSIWRQ